MENLKQLSLEISIQNDKLSYINMELEIKQSKLQDFENENVSALRKNTSDKAFCEKTNKAKEIQKQYKEFVAEIRDIEKQRKMHEKDLHASQSQYETVQKQFNVTKGLFQTRFFNVMDEMKL